MITIIEIDTDLVEYVAEQTGFDPDESETLISEILSMATIKPGNELARQKMYFTTVRGINRFIAYAKPEPFVTDPASPIFPAREPGPLYFEIADTREAALEKLAAGLISGGVPNPPPFFWAWYDFYIGFYYDRKNKILYFAPFPTFVFVLWRGTPSNP